MRSQSFCAVEFNCLISIRLGKPVSIFVCDFVWVLEAGLKNSVRHVGTGREGEKEEVAVLQAARKRNNCRVCTNIWSYVIRTH
jgi:hypothetical protein